MKSNFEYNFFINKLYFTEKFSKLQFKSQSHYWPVLVAVVYSSPIDGKIEGEDYSLKDKLKVAEKYVKLIEKEGVKAWHFLECMGYDWALHCTSQTLACVAARSLPGCIELITCEGKDAKSCASSFK